MVSPQSEFSGDIDHSMNLSYLIGMNLPLTLTSQVGHSYLFRVTCEVETWNFHLTHELLRGTADFSAGSAPIANLITSTSSLGPPLLTLAPELSGCSPVKHLCHPFMADTSGMRT